MTHLVFWTALLSTPVYYMIAERITPCRAWRTLQKMARAGESEHNHTWDELAKRIAENPNRHN